MTDSNLIAANGLKARGHKPAQRGVSLIEVLVVLVLLVTGILVIIRLYPSGFFSIQSTGNSALADGLGTAAIGTQTQDSGSLPDAILPVDSTANNLLTIPTAAIAAYDPDVPGNLDNARIISNETITVPSPANGQSLYAVKYGPIVLGTKTVPIDPKTSDVTQYLKYVSINSQPWAIQIGSAVDTPDTLSLLALGRPNYLVDYTNGQIALPYASYSQDFVLVVQDANNTTHTLYMTVPKEHATDTTANSTYVNGPLTNNLLDYQISTSSDYNGRWFIPTDANLNYVTLQNPTQANGIPLVAPWKAVMLYRAFKAIPNDGTAFDANDPYQFKLTADNIGTANINPGAIAFSPLAGGSKGLPALKAKISYVTYDWKILREDHDIPALSGSSTTVIRTTVQNLRQAGAAEPDNTIYPGIAGGGKSLYILDLDTGTAVGGTATPDPTNPDLPIIDEDTNGTSNDPTKINVSFATGRLTFGSQVFGATSAAHRIRIFYQSDLDWTVAVQKAPSYFAPNPAATPDDTTLLLANEYALDPSSLILYFAGCNAGKTIEVDGVATKGGVTTPFSDTVSIDPIHYTAGATNVRLALTDTSKLAQPVATGSIVTLTAVRGLSARAVVAWKERNQWKTHSVDAVLNRTP